MAKTHRGTGIRNLPSHGRGTCPLCHKEGIKIVYEQDVDGQKLKICKYCNAALKNKARNAPPAPVAAPETEAPAEEAVPAEETAPAAE